MAGQTTAIIGSTGAGKTTLLSLIPRLFDVTGGSVLVDGVDVRELRPRRCSGRRIGLVPQRPYLFSGTVAQQPALRQPRRDRRRAVGVRSRSRRRATSSRRCPSGLEAPIAQGGTNVSGGQRQRLAIARALVRQPEIYLFDDSFSALDLGTDARLRAALRPVTADAAVIVVAQRVSTIVDADQIIVLEDGEVVGHGRHDRAARDLPDLRRDRRVPAQRQEARRMSDDAAGQGATARARSPAACRGPARGRGGPPWMNVGHAGREVDDFGPSATAAARAGCGRSTRGCWSIVALGVTSVTLSVVGPKILGRATDIIFAGLVGKKLPAGSTVQQAVDQARGAGRRQPGRTCSAGCDVDPRRRHRLRPRCATCCCWRWRCTSAPACCCGCRATCSTASSSGRPRLRAEVEDKLNRLPLPYFDGQPRGELLSRVTNDIDNIAQTLQQTLSQLLTSLLTVVGVLVDDVRDLAAAGGDRARRRAAVGARHAADRQALAEAVRRAVAAHRRAQRADRGGVHRATSW